MGLDSRTETANTTYAELVEEVECLRAKVEAFEAERKTTSIPAVVMNATQEVIEDPKLLQGWQEAGIWR